VRSAEGIVTGAVTAMPEVSRGQVLVMVALPEEAGPMVERLRRLGQAVRVHVSGAGPSRAARAAEKIVERERPAAIVCAGLAGGLQAGFRRGEMVLATRVMDREGVFDADAGLLSAARQVESLREATVLTVNRVLCTAREKSEHAHLAQVVDMESAAVARVAARAAIPFLAVRVISDAHDEEFPIDLSRYIDAEGNVKRLHVALAALAKPSRIAFLLRMHKSSQQGAQALARYCEKLMEVLGRSSQ
jgi:adenosylhomocysteine nucleosidase